MSDPSPTATISALGIKILGSEDRVREVLNALPEEYESWKAGLLEAPRRRLSSLVDELLPVVVHHQQLAEDGSLNLS